MPEVKSPGPVPKEALTYFRAKDLRPGFHYQDVWGDEHAHAFTVAKAVKLDILQDIRDGLDESLADGKTFRQFANEITPTLQRKGWWGVKEQTDPITGEKSLAQLGSPRRLKTIYSSNMRAARSAGQWERVQRTKDLQPYLLYQLGPSRNHRDDHVKLQGLLLPVDDPMWQEIMPPNGYGCKCHVRQITRPEADRLRKEGAIDTTAPQEIDPATNLPTGRRVEKRIEVKTTPPDLKRRNFVNKRTGEVHQVLEGVHPAWSSNPGQARTRVIREHLAGRLESVDQTLASYAVADVVSSPVFTRYVKDVKKRGTVILARTDKAGARKKAIDEIGELPVGYARRDVQQLLGTSTQLVRVSPETMAKQLKHHPELKPGDYQLVSAALESGELIQESAGNIHAYYEQSGKLWRAVFKVAGKNKREIYLTSMHRTADKNRQRARRRHQVIRQQEKGK